MQGTGPDHDYVFKLLLLGNETVGKSNIMRRFCEGEFLQEHVSTVGIEFKSRILNVDNKIAKFQIWDTSGQERFRTITTHYYRRVNGIMLIYSIDNRQSFLDIERWLEDTNKYANEKVVKILIGNKSDLEGQRQVTFDEAKAYADEKGMRFFEVSAKTEEYLEEALFWIAGEMKTEFEREEQNLNKEAENNIVIVEKKTESQLKPKRTGCC